MPRPDLPDDFELIKLRDCYPYRRLYEGFADLTGEDGVLDYASDDSRAALGAIQDDLHDLGFRRHEITTSAAIALVDLNTMRKYVEYVEEPGDLLVAA